MATPWSLTSFDPPPPPVVVEVIPMPTQEEVDGIRLAAYDEGYAFGLQEGHAEGHAKGHQEGLDAGLLQGHQQAYDEGRAEVAALTAALESALQAIGEMPAAIEAEMAELAFTVGERLAAREGMSRAPFLAAVQEALMRLPKPGETLLLRVGVEERASWQELVENSRLPFGVNVLEDADVRRGQAYIELSGARMDIGADARRALVRLALGLPQDEA
jgi:flagellar assembly protein FliH